LRKRRVKIEIDSQILEWIDRQVSKGKFQSRDGWVDENGHWIGYDREELPDWPIDDVEEAYPVFETPEFIGKQRIEA
jgi:hypothetical protein